MYGRIAEGAPSVESAIEGSNNKYSFDAEAQAQFSLTGNFGAPTTGADPDHPDANITITIHSPEHN